MKKKEIIHQKLTDIRGKIIGECIEIEESLTIRLADYFFHRNSKQKTLFYWLILNPKRFEDKIKLFEKIDYFKKRKYYLKVKSSLRYVQDLRNKLAHWELIINRSEPDSIVLMNPINLLYFPITNKVLEEFYDNIRTLNRFFGYI